MVIPRQGRVVKRKGMIKEPAEKRGYMSGLFIVSPFPTRKSKELNSGKFESLCNGYSFKATGMLPRGIGARLLIVSLTTHLARRKNLEISIGDLLSLASSRNSKDSMIKAINHFSNTSFSWWKRGRPVLTNVRFKTKSKLFIVPESFLEHIIKSPIPIDLNMVEALRCSALALDLYFWLSYKTFYQRKRLTVSWNDLKLQFGQSYGNDRSGRWFFKRSVYTYFRDIYLKCEYPMISIDEQGIHFKYPNSKL